MKNLQSLTIKLLLLFTIIGCSSNITEPIDPQKNLPPQPHLEVQQTGSYSFIDSTHYDFGDLTQKEVVKHKFIFQNNGNYPIRIESVKSGGGDVVPKWNISEILPQDSGVIELLFDPKGKRGPQRKATTVKFTNAEPQYVILKLSSNIVAAENDH